MKTLLRTLTSPRIFLSQIHGKMNLAAKNAAQIRELDNLITPESYLQNMGSQKDYQAEFLINRGACAEVYESLYVPQNRKVAIKAISTSSLINHFLPKKELVFLSVLKHENIVEMEDYFIEEDSGFLCLVLKYFPNERCLSPKDIDFISPDDLKGYMKDLLKALDYCHSLNVFHLDIKPHNVLVDVQNKKVKLIDFGSADFYVPGKENRLKVYSRFMKPPEVLLGNKNYNLKADIWATGAIFAGMIFHRDPFFQGSNLVNQILSITEVVGSKNVLNYIDKHNLEVEESLLRLIQSQRSKPLNFRDLITSSNRKYATEEAINLIEQMLKLDHVPSFMNKIPMNY